MVDFQGERWRRAEYKRFKCIEDVLGQMSCHCSGIFVVQSVCKTPRDKEVF
jgi:hypothetical protein